jgi:DNA helicase IV
LTQARPEIAAEQAHLDRAYARIDQLAERAQAQLRRVRAAGSTGTPQARSERDVFAQALEQRVAQLRGVQDRLCFGRLDLVSGEQHHIGRIGLSDEQQEKLLVDWRAPVAAPFYQATPASPAGVLLRRHLTTRGRTVVGLDDEVMDLDAIDDERRATLHGEGALMAAVRAPRTGRMGDIVATIQGEQDRIVRDELAGVLVVQGGPGTGKTAVALHRAAYLLFTYRERLERSGVLVVGPGPLFLRYIEQVLPSLGESGVVMATPATLYPGVEAVGDDRDDVAAIKGDIRMAMVLEQAVKDRQRLPDDDLDLKIGSHRITLTRAAVAASRARARATGAPHNEARVTFVKDLLRHLAGLLAESMGQPLTDDLRAELDADLRDTRDVRVTLNLLWMPLSAERFLADLFATPVRLESAAGSLHPAERLALQRDRGAAWTLSDVPLLDEVAELIGDDGEAARVQAFQQKQERAAELEYARGVLQMAGDRAPGVSVDMLADQFASTGAARSVVDRAAQDRTWAFGHLVVDEAQELSPMMWRLLARRCPGRSWTVVGDLAQRGFGRRRRLVGRRAGRCGQGPVAGARAQRQLPDAGPRHGGRRRHGSGSRMTRSRRWCRCARALTRQGSRRRATGNDEVVVDVVRQLLTDAEAGTMAVVAPAAEVPVLAMGARRRTARAGRGRPPAGPVGTGQRARARGGQGPGVRRRGRRRARRHHRRLQPRSQRPVRRDVAAHPPPGGGAPRSTARRYGRRRSW